jgi:hypothetical protein
MVMAKKLAGLFVVLLSILWSTQWLRGSGPNLKPEFHTSDRCFACHNELATSKGRDISIGLAWRSSIMANSARDPYWQASVRRETMDHPQVIPDIEDECSVCHMPVMRYEAKLQGKKGEIFKQLPFDPDNKQSAAAVDGVTCSICHQITKEKLGTRESFNGGFVIETPDSKDKRPEYGPFAVPPERQHIMNTSTGGFQPVQAQHIRDSALCGSCHQLYTTARGPNGEAAGSLPEQMPYLEWLHSDYPSKYSCQGCHMPEVQEPVNISSVLGVLRSGMHQHVFVGGNFLLQQMLSRYRDELDVAALPQELTAASEATLTFLQTQSARIELGNVQVSGGRLQTQVAVHNLTGHKLPTAYPSRRAWLHFSVQDHNGKTLFESGALKPDGSIAGNDNDADPSLYEPHYREISAPDQVQIYESILKDRQGYVTTGLLAAIGYSKDNRLLPTGFDKKTAEKDIAVAGDASDDPNFTAGQDLVTYSVPISDADAPFHITVELLYQPIGFRWAHNLEGYKASEPQRFVAYYDSMSSAVTTVLARAEATR